jgi:hypothetical protein
MRSLCGAGATPVFLRSFPCFARRHVPSCVLTVYQRWFRRPAHLDLSRHALLFLPTPVSHLRVFFRFRMGVHALPIDINVGRRGGVPRLLCHCDMCGTGAVW